jgi:hypothetical protein
MHPTIMYQLAQARGADLRRRAQQEATARAGRRTRPGRRGRAIARWLAAWRPARRSSEHQPASWPGLARPLAPQSRPVQQGEPR